MASHKIDTYQIEPRTYVLFRLCLSLDDEWQICKIFSD